MSQTSETFPFEGNPYYDLTDDEVAKDYRKILARPGKSIQAREINVMQGLLSRQIQDVGNLIARDGTIISGCDLLTDYPAGGGNLRIRVTAGTVYIGGRSIKVPDSGFILIGTGVPEDLAVKKVDVVLTYTAITEIDDPELLSPAEGKTNFQQAGAHRLYTTASIQIDSEDGVTLYELHQGFPLTLSGVGVFSELEDVLSARTYDESGNYLVNGLTLRADGDDFVAFASQAAIKPTSGSAIGTVSPGPTSHPYGTTWTNRFTRNSGYPDFAPSDVGLILEILDFTDTTNASPNTGIYEILRYISPAEVEIDGQLVDAAPQVNAEHRFRVKGKPANVAVIASPGKAYIKGRSTLKPVPVTLSIPKAIDTRGKNDEVKPLTFRSFQYTMNSQPFSGLRLSAGEGVSARVFSTGGMTEDEKAGWGDEQNGPTRTVGLDYDDLGGLLPGTTSLVKVVAAASTASTWEWHLDPADPDYPGVFVGGEIYVESLTHGWSLGSENKLYWAGIIAGDQPDPNDPYKIVLVISRTLTNGKDFRVRSNASAILYQAPGSFTTPVTSSALFFAQATYNLSIGGADRLRLTVDGKLIDVQFGSATAIAVGLTNLAAATIAQVINVINKYAYDATAGHELAGIASVQFEQTPSPVTNAGWIVLQSPTTGSTSQIQVEIGSPPLGFYTGMIAVGSDEPDHVLSLGGFRAFGLIAGAGEGQPYEVQIDYDFALYRTDLITLDSKGEFHRHVGTPDTAAHVIAPNGSQDALSIGSIALAPLSANATITNYDNLRTTMSQLRKMEARISNLEWNGAAIDLDRDTVGGMPVGELSGAHSEGFIGFNKADTTFLEDDVEFSTAIDIVEHRAYLPFNETEQDLYLGGTGIDTSLTTAYTGFRSLVTLPIKQEVDAINWPYVSSSYGLNLLGVYPYLRPRIYLFPSYDNWIDSKDTSSIVQGQTVATKNVWSWAAPQLSDQKDAAEIQNLNWKTGETKTPVDAAKNASDQVTRQTSIQIIEDSKAPIKARQITLTGEGFIPLEPHIRISFGDVPVSATLTFTGSVSGPLSMPPGSPPAGEAPDKSYVNGQYAGTVQANSTGRFVARFFIPSGTFRTGEVKVVAIGSLTTSAAATTVYVTSAERNAKPALVAARPRWLPETPADDARYTVLAQIFYPPTKDILITAVVLYFTSIDPTRPITVSIRNVENGKPGVVSYGEKVLYSSDFNQTTEVSTNGSKGKEVRFPDPVYLPAGEDYALVLDTAGTGYSVGVAKSGAKDLNSSRVIGVPPAWIKTLFVSADGRSWKTGVPSGDTVLAFKLKAAVFVEGVITGANQVAVSATLQFNPVDISVDPIITDFLKFILLVDSAPMTSSSLFWYFSIDSGAVWYPLTPYEVVDTAVVTGNGTLPHTITFKAVLVSRGTYSTPLILKSTARAALRRFQSPGNYITKRVDLASGMTYDTVEQSLKYRQGTGGSVTVYFGYTDVTGHTVWIPATTPSTSTTPIGDGFIKETWVTKTAAPSPDMTLPASLTGSVVPSSTNPTFSGLATHLQFDLTWNNAGTPTVESVDVTFSAASLPAATVVSEINAKITTSHPLLAALGTVASLSSQNQVVLTVPQSGGHQTNSIVISAVHAGLGFTNAQTAVGGTITAATSGGGSLPADDYYYVVLGSDGLGSTQTVPDPIDQVKVTALLNDRVTLSFDVRGKTFDKYLTEYFVYRSPDGTGTWKKLGGAVPLGTGGVPTGAFIDTGDLTETAVGSIPENEEEALRHFTNFRGRVELASTAPTSSPIIREFTNLFISP